MIPPRLSLLGYVRLLSLQKGIESTKELARQMGVPVNSVVAALNPKSGNRRPTRARIVEFLGADPFQLAEQAKNQSAD